MEIVFKLLNSFTELMSKTNKFEDWIRIRQVIKGIDNDTFINYGINRIINQLFGDFKSLLLKVVLLNENKEIPDNGLPLFRDILEIQKQINNDNANDNDSTGNEPELTLECLPKELFVKTTNYLSILDVKTFCEVSTSVCLSCINVLGNIDLMVIDAQDFVFNDRIAFDQNGVRSLMRYIRVNASLTLLDYIQKIAGASWFFAWNRPYEGSELSETVLNYHLFSYYEMCTKLKTSSNDYKNWVTKTDGNIENENYGFYVLKYFDVYKQQYYVIHYLKINHTDTINDFTPKIIELIENKLLKQYPDIFGWLSMTNMNVANMFTIHSSTFYVGTKQVNIKVNDKDAIIFELNIGMLTNENQHKLDKRKQKFNDDGIPFYYDYKSYLKWTPIRQELILSHDKIWTETSQYFKMLFHYYVQYCRDGIESSLMIIQDYYKFWNSHGNEYNIKTFLDIHYLDIDILSHTGSNIPLSNDWQFLIQTWLLKRLKNKIGMTKFSRLDLFLCL